MQLTAPQVKCGVSWSGRDGAREGEDLVVEIAVSGGGTRTYQQGQQAERGG
jgi:hypothetical protein